MAVCLLLREVVVFLCIVKSLNGESDLLESIQLDGANPPEVNDFLRNVLQHKKVFSWIRHTAREAEKDEEQQQGPYRADMQAPTYNRGGTFLKRNVRNRRPLNDVHPYMFEDEKANDELAMRNPQRKRRRQKDFSRSRRSKGSVSLDLSNEQDSGVVKVAPRSEAGVLNVPGQKYGSKRGIKRTCKEESDQHERVQKQANTTKSNSTKNEVDPEYYFTTPHDVLGLDQDISKEYQNNNETCLETKKSAIRRQNNGQVSPNKLLLLRTFPTTKLFKQPMIQNQIPNQIYQQQQILHQQQQMLPQQQQMLHQQSQSFRQAQQLQELSHKHVQTFPVTPLMAPNKTVNTVLAHKKPSMNLNDAKMQDFEKLINYVETPNKEAPQMTKQDLLRKDNDDVLEHIDRILKSDRSGLNMFHDVSGVRYTAKREDEEAKSPIEQSYNRLLSLTKVPVKRSYKSDDIKDLSNADVDITLNSQPVDVYKSNSRTAIPRKINFLKKNYKNAPKFNTEKTKLTYDTTPLKDLIEDSLPAIDQQTNDAQQQMLSDPNLKILENADDENNSNLKQTLKEYINRQNQYNLGKQPDNEDEDEVTPDYRLVQEKKNQLEDQSEPTSAAEQRELGRKNGFVTPSMLNDTDAEALIVIPLKKSAPSGRNGDYDLAKESFKVKEAKDVIHVRQHNKEKNQLNKKETNNGDELENTIFTKDMFDKMKDEIDRASHDEISEEVENKECSAKEKKKTNDYRNVGDYNYENGIKHKTDKLDPEKQAVDYDDYENLDMKRDTNSYKSRKLASFDKSEMGMVREKVEKLKSDVRSINRRSEDEEPDEEPGNDSKEPTVEEKKVQQVSPNKYSPKKEEDEMTLHMDLSPDVKRNDSDNDYPPDDENEFATDAGNKNGSQTIISYNFYNITVNMPTTTSSYPGGTENGPEELQTDKAKSYGPNEKDQLLHLAQDILKYAAKNKDKFTKYKSYSKVHPKEIEDETNTEANENGRDDASNNLNFNVVRKILDKVGKVEEKDTGNKHDEDSEDEIKLNDQIHGIRNAVDDARHRELLVSKLEHLMNSYKSQLEQADVSEEKDVENIGKRSDVVAVHHHTPKKQTRKPLPHPDCGATYPRGRGAVPLIKRVMTAPPQPLIPPQEIYYEPESMADDLKEKLLFDKIYNRVIRKRKKAPDPIMYKIIDSVFGNDEEVDDNMCPVDLEDDNMDAIEMPTKRTTESDETTTPDTGSGLIDISQQKKSKYAKNLEPKEVRRRSHNSFDDSRVKLDNVDSFKDVIELPNREIRKRELEKNLEDFPKSYLSPINENKGFRKNRKRRRLRYLHGPQKIVRQINYDDYVQAHGLGPNRLAMQRLGTPVNFKRRQNFNVKERKQYRLVSNNTDYDTRSIQSNTTTEAATNGSALGTPIQNVDYNITQKNCTTELETLKANRSKMIECELKKKEHEDMRKMLNGFLPLKIIDIFYNKLKENSGLYNRFGGTISNSKQCASENAHNVKTFREEQAKVDIKHAEEMLHEVIVMLNQIVADQVHRRTCLQLAPNLKIFVIRITKNLRTLKKNYQVAEGYPLPKIKSRSGDEFPALPPEEDQGDFLFGKDEQQANGAPDGKTEIRKKIKLIERLLDKYQTMTMRCQVQVEPVKDYLLKHLGMLMKLLEQVKDTSTCATTVKDQEPLVREEELAVPHGNISIPRVIDIVTEASPATTITSGDMANQQPTQQPSEVEQRQQVMIDKQQEQQQKQQQLQRQIQEQELLEQQQRLQQEQLQQQQVQQEQFQQLSPYQEGPLEQPHARDSKPQNLQADSSTPNGQQDSQRQAPSPQPTDQQAQPQQSKIEALHKTGGNQAQINQPANQTTTVAVIVEQELDPTNKKYTNPEMVSKDLMDMGLEGANTYLPPFDVNGIVQENVIKADMAANAAGQLIPHIHSEATSKMPTANGTKKRDVSAQNINYEMLKNAGDKSDGKIENVRQAFDSPENSQRSTKSKNKELQDLMTKFYSKPFLDKERPVKGTKIKRQAGNATQPPRPNQQHNGQQNNAAPAQQPQQPKDGYANYGKEQFIFQPLVVNPTEVPDPDVEDTEYYTGQRYSEPLLVNKDLADMGLDGEINSYVLPFSINSVVQNQIQASTQHTDPKFPVAKPATVLTKRGRADDERVRWNVSEKYKKLMDAYHRIREKRQNEERIGKLYGMKATTSKLDGLKSVKEEINDVSKISFEKPIVFSLDG